MSVCVEKKEKKTNYDNNTIRHKAQMSKKKEKTLFFFTQIKEEFFMGSIVFFSLWN